MALLEHPSSRVHAEAIAKLSRMFWAVETDVLLTDLTGLEERFAT